MSSDSAFPVETNPGNGTPGGINPTNTPRRKVSGRKNRSSQSVQQHGHNGFAPGSDPFQSAGFALPSVRDNMSGVLISPRQVTESELQEFFAYKQARHDEALRLSIMAAVQSMVKKEVDKSLHIFFDKTKKIMQMVDKIAADQAAPSRINESANAPAESRRTQVALPPGLLTWGLPHEVLTELKEHPELLIDGEYMTRILGRVNFPNLQTLHRVVFKTGSNGNKAEVVSKLVDYSKLLGASLKPVP